MKQTHIKLNLLTQKAFLYWSAITLFMLVSIFWLPLHPDEAYYWVWSKNVALSYYDGPPLTAWLLRIWTDIFGIHIWSIKLIAVTAVSISSILLYHLTNKLFDKDVALKALLIFLLIPIIQATNFITTLDPLLLLLWTWSLLLFWNWLQQPSLLKTISLGIVIGLGLLAKYTMILFLPCAFIILLFKDCRQLLLSYKPYLCVMIAIIISSPIWVWNYHHDWISLGFQWHHGTKQSHFSMSKLLSYLGGQCLDFNVIYFLGLIYLSCRYYKDYKQFKLIFLLIPTLFILFIFGYFGLSNLSEPNWTMPAYITASILLAYFCDKRRISWVFITGLVLNVSIIILLKFPYFMPNMINKLNPIVKIEGYQQLINSLDLSITNNALPIISDTYQDASEVEYFIKQHPNVCIVTPTRTSQITMHCTNFKNRLQKHGGTVLWMGPSNQYSLIKNTMNQCHVIAYSQYNNAVAKKQWLLAKCNGQLK